MRKSHAFWSEIICCLQQVKVALALFCFCKYFSSIPCKREEEWTEDGRKFKKKRFIEESLKLGLYQNCQDMQVSGEETSNIHKVGKG